MAPHDPLFVFKYTYRCVFVSKITQTNKGYNWRFETTIIKFSRKYDHKRISIFETMMKTRNIKNEESSKER